MSDPLAISVSGTQKVPRFLLGWLLGWLGPILVVGAVVAPWHLLHAFWLKLVLTPVCGFAALLFVDFAGSREAELEGTLDGQGLTLAEPTRLQVPLSALTVQETFSQSVERGGGYKFLEDSWKFRLSWGNRSLLLAETNCEKGAKAFEERLQALGLPVDYRVL